LDESFWRALHAVYLGSISFSDYLFGLLLAAVDEYKYTDSTTIAVFADHGDYAGDYGLVEKWPSGLEDVLTRVPFLWRTPGGSRGTCYLSRVYHHESEQELDLCHTCLSGHVVTSPVQIYDLVPTLLELAGIEVLRHSH